MWSKPAVNGGICPRIFRNSNWFIIIFGKRETTGLIEILHDTLRERVRVKKGKEARAEFRISGFAIGQNSFSN